MTLRSRVLCLLMLAVAGLAAGDDRSTVIVRSGAVPLTIGPYGYDGSANVKTIGSDSYVYDSAGRMVSGTAGFARRQDYSYDAFGNLQTITTDGNPAAQIKLHVDPATNQASIPSPLSPSFNAYGNYDAAGNMTSFGDAGPFVYDALGMITDSTIAGRRTVYLYTPSDERVASITLDKAGTQWTEGQSEWTLRGSDQKILRRFLRSATGTWTWDEDYIYRRGLLLAAEVSRNEKTLRFHLDHLGTPRLITGNGGAEVSRHAYYPFGFEATSTTSFERLQFTGHERDRANLDYMHARYYQVGWGRFLSVDPVLDIEKAQKEPQLWNRYSYVTNNPLKYVDADGRERLISNSALPSPANARANWSAAVRAVREAIHLDHIRDALSGWSGAPASERLMAAGVIGISLLDAGSWFVGGEGKGAAKLAGEGAEALGFKSFGAFKRMFGAAGEGMQWHHIVEQTGSNTARFGPEALHNTVNLIRMDTATHAKISAHYSSKIPGVTGDQTVRQWLATKSYKEQYEYGRQVLRQYGVTK